MSYATLSTVATGDTAPASDWNQLKANDDYFASSHNHSGVAGDGSANLKPADVTLADEADPSAPGAGKTIIWAGSGKLKQRAGASGAVETFSVVGHTHSISETGQQQTVYSDASTTNSEDGGLGGTYTHQKRATRTPGTATRLVSCVGAASMSNGSGSGTHTGYVRILVDSVQKKEATVSINDPGRSFLMTEWASADLAVSAHNYDAEFKSSGFSHLVLDASGLIITEIQEA